MARTQLNGQQINDGSILRADLNIATAGSAVITKLIAGTGITMAFTGADSGTGDVTINSTGGTGAVSSVFGRTGAVVKAVGDYSFGDISGTVTAAAFPALTGDLITTAGSLATTLATVNANIGTFNSVTVNAKGLVTAATLVSNQITTPLASTANTGYNDNSSYYGYATVANGFPAAGSFTGTRFGTVGTQRLQAEAGGSTYARAWNNAGSAWAAWIIFLDADDFTAKGQVHIGTGSSTYVMVPVGADGTVLTASSAATSGVAWTTPAGGGAVSSVFGRTGAVVKAVGDYSFSDISGVLQATAHPALTGDITTPSGSVATTLAAVNSNIGTFNSVTVNAKGLVIAASTVTNQIATPLAATANTGYNDNSSYYGYATTANGFPIAGSFSGARFGTVGTQRLQGESGGLTYARAWSNSTTAWLNWTLYFDSDDFTAKGNIIVGTGAGTSTMITPGADGTVLTASAAATAGVVWATPAAGAATPGGSTTQIQYNNAGAFAGATGAVITSDSFIKFVDTTATPATPTGGITTYAKRRGNRTQLVQLDSDGFEYALQASLASNRISYWAHAGNSAAVTFPILTSIGLNTATVGTLTARNVAVNQAGQDRRLGFVTTATAGLSAELYNTAAQWARGTSTTVNTLGFYAYFKFKISDGTNGIAGRFFAGMAASVTATPNAATSSILNCIGMGCDTTDTSMAMYTNDGTTTNKVALGSNFPSSYSGGTVIYEVRLYCIGTTGAVGYHVTSTGFVANPIIAQGTLSLNLPGTAVLMAPRIWRNNGAAASVVAVDVVSMYIETVY